MGGIISNSSTVDQMSQALSVFNVIDQIDVDLKAKELNKVNLDSVEKIPVPINFQVISMWKRNNLSDENKSVNSKLHIEFVDPIGEKLNETTFDLPIAEGKKRTRYILNVNGMFVTRTGEYLVQFREMFSKDEKSEVLGTLILDVVVNKS